MTTLARHPVFYATFSVVNQGVNAAGASTPLIPATITEEYRTPILAKADDYVCAVERFEISSNGVPYYQQAPPPLNVVETVTITDTAGPNEDVLVTFSSFSLPDTINKLQALMSTNPFELSSQVRWTVDSEGFVRVLVETGFFMTKGIDLTNAPILNRILGLETDAAGATDTELVSPFPRWDCGDQLNHFRITSTLPTTSDSVGQGKSNILTDLSFPDTISASYAYPADSSVFGAPSVSYTQRQKVIYNPADRRFLNLRSSAPIGDITLTCEFVRPGGSTSVVSLPKGGEFTIKLGFWNMKAMVTQKDENFQSGGNTQQQPVVF